MAPTICYLCPCLLIIGIILTFICSGHEINLSEVTKLDGRGIVTELPPSELDSVAQTNKQTKKMHNSSLASSNVFVSVKTRESKEKKYLQYVVKTSRILTGIMFLCSGTCNSSA